MRILLFLPLAAGLLGSTQRALRPVQWDLLGPDPVMASGGGRFQVLVRARIDQDWHLYSLTQPAGAKPTRIDVVDTARFLVDGPVRSPAPDTIPDPSLGLWSEVHDDSVSFLVPILVREDIRPGRHRLQLTVTFQTCSGRLCLSPRTDTLATNVLVSP